MATLSAVLTNLSLQFIFVGGKGGVVSKQVRIYSSSSSRRSSSSSSSTFSSFFFLLSVSYVLYRYKYKLLVIIFPCLSLRVPWQSVSVQSYYFIVP